MFRVQSELWPLQADGTKSHDSEWHSKVEFTTSKSLPSITIILRRRKNQQHEESRVSRDCICADQPSLCFCCLVRHRVDEARTSPSQKVFPDLIPHVVTASLRLRCVTLNIDMASRMGWHAFRRGRATDLMREGSPISTILQLGGWKSPAVLSYLVREEIDQRVAGAIMVDASESD